MFACVCFLCVLLYWYDCCCCGCFLFSSVYVDFVCCLGEFCVVAFVHVVFLRVVGVCVFSVLV